MNTLFVSVAFGLGALLSAGAYAAAPAGAIALCKDGTYFTGTEHKGACKGHQGVKEWLDKDKAAAAAATPAATAAPAAASDASKSSKSKKTSTDTAAAPAGAIAQCKDGTYSTAKTKRGACSKHGGIATWLADQTPATAPPAGAGIASTFSRTRSAIADSAAPSICGTITANSSPP